MQPANPNDAAGIPVGRFGITNETADRAVTMLTNGYLTGTIDLGGVYPPRIQAGQSECVGCRLRHGRSRNRWRQRRLCR